MVSVNISRVSGVQIGSSWRARITDPGSPVLAAPTAPISWPISSLERATLATNQVQTAELKRFYPGTAWAAHGNYGLEYDLTLPLQNTGSAAVTLQLSLDSPLKGNSTTSLLRFRDDLNGPGFAIAKDCPCWRFIRPYLLDRGVIEGRSPYFSMYCCLFCSSC